jgi:hypothetical protein
MWLKSMRPLGGSLGPPFPATYFLLPAQQTPDSLETYRQMCRTGQVKEEKSCGSS